MSNLKYLRKFIMLEPLNSRTNIKGYSKVEIRDGKGKIELNIDGISNKEKSYDVYFISDEDNIPTKARLGKVFDEGNGKGSLKKEFSPKNILKSDKGIDDYNLLVVKDSSDDLLYGYIHKEQKDKDILSIISSIQEENIEKKHKKSLNPKEEKMKKPEVKIEEDKTRDEIHSEVKNLEDKEEKESEKLQQEESSSENKEEKSNINIHEDAKEVDEKIKEDVQIKDENVKKDERIEESEEETHSEYPNADENIEEYFVNKKEEIQSLYKENEDFKSKENIDNYNSKGYSINNTPRNNYINQLAEYSLNILKYFNEIEPLAVNLEGYKFWEIKEVSMANRRGFLPFYNYIVNMQYPYGLMNRMATASKLIRKYSHYIFGIVTDKSNHIKYYVYGIPGRFLREEQPYRGMSGFTTWIENKNTKEDIGYWLLHIDAASGRIVTPLRPTNPR